LNPLACGMSATMAGWAGSTIEYTVSVENSETA
jgi:hypothetical protein